ncbi:hypothetical protein BX616_009845 [Lobosporangium transversale]|nr:hypothetical protein BX616_009845 [Lobosporangium transversale]
MKFFKTTLAAVGVLTLLAAPVTAQYEQYVQEQQQQQQQQQQKSATSEKHGVAGLMDLAKALLIGGSPPPVLFVDDPTGAITNITDANYKDTIFEDEWIIAFCSFSSAPCADYFPTYLDAAVTMQNETQTKFAAVWVEENPRLSARFIVPARLPYVIYAKDGDFRHIPYVRNDTQYLITFIEEEKYKFYSVLDGPMGPYSTISSYFVKYAEFMEWVGKYTSWMPKWLIYIIAGSTSGMVFSFFSGGSNYSSDPSKYPHLNPDGTLKKVVDPAAAPSGSSTSTKTTKTTTTTTTKKRSAKKA